MIKRKTLKPRQRDIAKNLSTHPVYLNAVLRGRARPSPDLALRISKLTGIPVMFLLYREITKRGRWRSNPQPHIPGPTLLFFGRISNNFSSRGGSMSKVANSPYEDRTVSLKLLPLIRCREYCTRNEPLPQFHSLKYPIQIPSKYFGRYCVWVKRASSDPSSWKL